jgi:NADH-quinone oxidoreductase subunit H
MMFALFFLGEYVSILLMAALTSIFFFGGWLLPFFQFIPPFFIFAVKIYFVIVLFIYIRAALPRYRYDQLMQLGWTFFLPLALSLFLFYTIINII